MTNETDTQEKLVFWGYLIQWTSLLIPPALAVSLIYLLVVRHRVIHGEIRSHMNWQLATCGAIVAAILIAIGLLFVGLSGVNTDSAISMIATFLLMGASALFVPWFLYRLLLGTIRFARQQPMHRLFP